MAEIIGLLILKNRFTLMSEIKADYDSKFVIIAIENDGFDIVFYFRDKYPQSFIRGEIDFLEPILLSFTKSNHCWLAKIFMLKSVISYLSYRRAEDFLFTLGGKIEKSDPKDSPLYFTPNLLLLILNLYEI